MRRMLDEKLLKPLGMIMHELSLALRQGRYCGRERESEERKPPASVFQGACDLGRRHADRNPAAASAPVMALFRSRCSSIRKSL